MLPKIVSVGRAFILFVFCMSASSLAKGEEHRSATSLVQVPFVGCKDFRGNGGGDITAPKGKTTAVRITLAAGKKLAYYEAYGAGGVLAPRKWHCVAGSGSNGGKLIVTPFFLKQIEDFDGTGPAVISSFADASTSGRFTVAALIARFFPAYKLLTESVIKEGLEPAGDFPSGPFPNDRTTFLNDHDVVIFTPPNSEGFGTSEYSGFKKNAYPVYSRVSLSRPQKETEGFLNQNAGWEGTGVFSVYVRLQPDRDDLATQIIR